MAVAANARQRVQMRVRNPDLPDYEPRVSSADRGRRSQSMRRLILKQGYLKKLPNAAKLGANLKKAVRRWFVFGVMNGKDPYLEYYEDEDSVFSSHPINIIFLDVCHDVNQTGRHSNHDHVFIVALRDRNLRLVAQSRSIMLEWARVIREKLVDLNVLRPSGPNDYCMPPMPNRQSRESSAIQRPQSQVVTRQGSRSGPQMETPSGEMRDSDLVRSQIDEYVECGGTFDNSFRRNGNIGTTANNVDGVTGVAPTGSPPPPEVNETDPFPAFAASADGVVAATPGAISKAQEAGGGDAVVSWNAPPEADERAPPPYMARGMLLRDADVSLKHSQVSQLKGEMASDGGVALSLSKLDCHHTIAFVDCACSVRIAGWNQTARPYLYRSLHIGDQVISINGQVVESAKMTTKLIKSCTHQDCINIVIRRLPNAKVFGFRRTADGESLGIKRGNGTAEIVYVTPEGLSSRQGLPSKAMTLEGDDFCNWWITEINHRPLNLSFKNDEIEHRLNAVGRDISLVVQPIEFIRDLKHQLKKLKYYKDFMVQ